MMSSGITIRKKVYKLAIIGGGVDSAVGYTHLIASQMDHRWDLVSACFSRKRNNNIKTVNSWNLGQIRTYDNWKQLLVDEQGKVDAVAILTPTPLHFEMVSDAIKLGIPVICEKSLASNYEEAYKICKLQNNNNGFLAVTHNYTGYPMLRELKSLVSDGEIGQVTQIQIEMPQEGFARLDISDNKPCPQAWRLVDGKIPGVTLDLGTHLQHMIHYITGENPCSLIADQNTFGWFKDVVDDVTIFAKYPSGMKSSMWYGKSALGHRNGLRIRLYATKASAEWFQMEPEVLTVYDVHGNKKILDRASQVQVAGSSRYQRFKPGHPAGFIEAFANIYSDIADKLDEYKQTGIIDENWTYGALQASKGLKFFEHTVESHSKKSWINLS